jgi:cytochrome c oxidase cbb3-type subunit 3
MKNKIIIIRTLGVVFALFTVVALKAQNVETAQPSNISVTLSLDVILATIALFLLIPIHFLKKVLVVAAQYYVDNHKEKDSKGSNVILALPLLLLMAAPEPGFAQEFSATMKSFLKSGNLTYLLSLLIFFELVIIWFMTTKVNEFLNPGTPLLSPDGKAVAQKSAFTRWWEKINNFKEPGQEETLDTGHNYDGIRELDNITPPWFTTAFVLSIIFSIIYLWRYHVVHSAPLQIEEFEIAMAQAAKEKEEYLKLQANSVDENTVTMLGAADIAAGKKLFAGQCAACHGEEGQSTPGGVGPNLSDDFSIHGGSIQDIFKTIKYGYPDKGMKSWKDDFSPSQIAQLASFVASIQGTNIAGGKEPQGNPIAAASAAPADSTRKEIIDSTAKK